VPGDEPRKELRSIVPGQGAIEEWDFATKPPVQETDMGHP